MEYNTKICSECDGLGTVEVLVNCSQSFSTDIGDQEEKTIWCDACDGDGELPNDD